MCEFVESSDMVAGGQGRQSPPSDNFFLIIANVKYYTKYEKSSLSTNSKIVVIMAFL